MLKTIEPGKREAVARIFEGLNFGYIADAILEGQLGAVLADDEVCPSVGILEMRFGDEFMFAILGGDANHPVAPECVERVSPAAEVWTLSPEWVELIRLAHGERVLDGTRRLLGSKRLDREHLKAITARVPADCRLVPLDLAWATRLAEEQSQFAQSHGVNYTSPSDFVDRGFGWLLLRDKEILSIASTFAVSSKGIEIQINTRDAHRRSGYGKITGAALTLDALERGLDPCWDASNEGSASLARSLGYTPHRTLKTLIVESSPQEG